MANNSADTPESAGSQPVAKYQVTVAVPYFIKDIDNVQSAENVAIKEVTSSFQESKFTTDAEVADISCPHCADDFPAALHFVSDALVGVKLYLTFVADSPESARLEVDSQANGRLGSVPHEIVNVTKVS